jgi:hypothetical protein
MSVQKKAGIMWTFPGLRVRRFRQRLAGGIPVTLVAVLVLAGCSGSEETPTTPPATPIPTIAPSPTPPLSLGAVAWATELGSDGAPVASIDAFPRDAPEIFALVNAEGIPAGEVLTAAWTIDEVPIDAVTAAVTIDGATSGWVSFSLTWTGEALWPVGTLGITITASSGETATGTVRIEST